MDKLETMRVFVAVAETGGFARGARRLAMSPPAVTRAVAALEQRVGATLLRRTTRVVTLTDAGAQFLADSRRILADVETAEATVTGAHDLLQGALSITASVMFGRMFVAPLLFDFLALHPGITARALFADQIVDLVEQRLDVAIRIARLPDSTSESATRVGSIRRVACASPGYLAAHGTPRMPRDLDVHRTIVFSQSSTPVDWSFRVAGKPAIVRPRGELVTSSSEVSIAAALAGHGVTLALSYQVAREIRAGQLVVVLEGFEPPAIPIHVLYRDGRRAPARVRAFARYAVERLRAETLLA